MKVVAILGSPRSTGGSATIARRFIETAAGLGAETGIFELNRLSYRGCQGCYACKNGLESCVVQDDLSEVLSAVAEADAVLLATPVYYGDVTAQLKGFIDRCFSYLVPDFYSNPQPSRLSDKKMVFVLTQGNSDTASYDDIYPRYSVFYHWMGFPSITLIRACGVGPEFPGGMPEDVLQQADDAARSLFA